MKLLGFLYMAAGAVLALLILRILHGQWNEFGQIALYAAIPNALTGLAAFALLRRPRADTRIDLFFLVACYVIGIGAGAYFYYT